MLVFVEERKTEKPGENPTSNAGINKKLNPTYGTRPGSNLTKHSHLCATPCSYTVNYGIFSGILIVRFNLDAPKKWSIVVVFVVYFKQIHSFTITVYHYIFKFKRRKWSCCTVTESCPQQLGCFSAMKFCAYSFNLKWQIFHYPPKDRLITSKFSKSETFIVHHYFTQSYLETDIISKYMKVFTQSNVSVGFSFKFR